MIGSKRWWVGLVLGLFTLAAAAPFILQVNITANAQGGNLLQDPGFEGPYVNRGRPDLNTPAAWNLWVADGPRNQEWQNRADKVFAYPHNNGAEVHGGGNSQNINGGYVTFTAAVYQQVNVTQGENVTGSIWARLKTCNLAPNSDNCGSAVESGAFVRAGIDPNGGTDPNSPSIVWSGNIAPHDTWQQATVSATAASGTVTFFAYVTQAWPSDLNNVWFDDASLSVGGAGGSAPPVPGVPTIAPPAAPVATAFVAYAYPPRPDGSVVHIVAPGDTMTGIASAYSVAIEDIMALNGLRGSRYIFVGQELLIKEAGSANATSEVTTGEATGGSSPIDLTGDLFSAEDLASLNPNPGPTPVGMSLTPQAQPTLAG